MKVQMFKWALIAFCICAVTFPAAFDTQLASAKSAKRDNQITKVSQVKQAKKSRKSSKSKKRTKKSSKRISKKKSRSTKKSHKRSYTKKRYKKVSKSKKSRKTYSKKRSVRHKKASKRSGRKKRSYYTCDQQNPSVLRAKAVPYEQVIQGASQKHGVNANLIKAVITAETCFDPYANSPKGARGLMQLMPATGRRFGATQRYNVYENVYAGTAYLRWLLNRYNGSLAHAVAAYNSGEGTVDKYGLGVPYKETQNYLRQVLNAYKKLNATTKGHSRAYYQQRWQHRQQLAAQKQRQQYLIRAGAQANTNRQAKVYNGSLQTLSCRMAPRRLYLSTRATNSGRIRSFHYTVSDNETLYQVAYRTGVPVEHIREYNKLSSVYLRTGLKLKVAQCYY